MGASERGAWIFKRQQCHYDSCVATATNITSIHASNEETVHETLLYFARIMGSDYGNIFLNYYEHSAPGILIMPRGIAQGIVDAGWTKETMKRFLWENSKFPWSVVTSDSDVFRRSKDVMKQYGPRRGAMADFHQTGTADDCRCRRKTVRPRLLDAHGVLPHTADQHGDRIAQQLGFTA